MKRPFALLGTGAFSALLLAAVLGSDAASVLAAVCAAAALLALLYFFLLRKRLSGKRAERAFLLSLLLVVTAASFFFSLYASAWEREFGPAQELSGKRVAVRGVVQDTPVCQYHRYYYLLRVERVMENDTLLHLPEFTLRISSSRALACEPYDTLLCTVQCSSFAEEGLYSTRNSRFADGVALGGYLIDSEPVQTVKGTGLSPGELAVRLREKIAEPFRELLPEREAGLVQAMLLGRKDELPESDVWNFRKIGASHLLVISGLHMAAVAAALCVPIRIFVRNARLCSVLSAGAVLAFLSVTGFPPSAQRSGLMCLVALWGAAIGRPPDSYNSLGLAVFLICLQNPFSGGDLSFTLSACSTLGILLGANRLTRRLLMPVRKRPILRESLLPIANSLSVTMSAMLFTLPIQAAVFGGVSLLSPLANLILIVPCTLLLYLSIPAAVLGLLPFSKPLVRPLFLLLRPIAGVALSLSEELASLHGGYLDLSRPAGVAALCVLICVGLIALCGRREGARRISAAVLTVCVALCACGQMEAQSSLVVAVAEDSESVVLLRGDSAAVLALGGYRTGAARELLSRNNVKEVDLLCFATAGREEKEAAKAILQAYPVRRVALPEGQRAPKELKSADVALFLEDGETISFLDGVTLRAQQELGVLTVSFGGARIVIETGQGKAEHGSCDLLITTRTEGKMNSPFTILQNSDIMTVTEESQVLLPRGNGLYAVFSEDGVCKFGGDSAWLGMNLT